MRIKQFLINLFPNIYAFFHYRNKNKNIDPSSYVQDTYFKRFGVKLNLTNPKTFYEKLNYLKLFYDNNKSTYYVDKVGVKNLIDEKSFGIHCSKTLAVFDSVQQFSTYFKENAKNSFVVKLNHTSGDVFFYNNGIWRTKIGESITKRLVFAKLKYGLKSNYYYVSFEKPYKNIKPKILVEEYLPSLSNKGLDEYKFFNNYGEIKMINVVYGRQDANEVSEIFTNQELESLGVYQKNHTKELKDIKVPQCFEDMKKFACSMSKQFPILRVDLMTNGEEYYFCEFTFFDCGGNNIFYPLEKNKEIGDLFNIEDVIIHNK